MSNVVLPFFESAINSGMATISPDTWYRDLQQAFISSAWDNTTSLRKTIEEQDILSNQTDYYENFTFHVVEAWVATIVGQSSTGDKSGRDFIRLMFEDITHAKLEGRYYKIDGEYYISYFDDRVVDVDANLSVRRCNEWMRIIDPQNGSIYKIPCVVDYDMSAPANKVTNAIITPNNHAVVKVQQNATTDRLFVTNARFILGNRPFKITGMQNATNQFIDNDVSSLMEIDLFLDEIWDKDDIANGIADNGIYNYTIQIIGDDMELTNGATGTLSADVTLNGVETTNVILWSSSDEKIVYIDNNGEYHVVGEVGEVATITATLRGNDGVFDTLVITVGDETSIIPDIVIDPVITFIRELETIEISVYGLYDGQMIVPNTVSVTLPTGIENYLTYTQDENKFTFTCLKRKSGKVNLIFDIESTTPAFVATKNFDIKLTSLLG